MAMKRFTKYVPDSYNYTSIITIVDNKTGKRSGSIDDFVDLLNEQHETIQELQSELQEQVDRKDACIKQAHLLDEENEQLKIQIKIFEAFLEGNDLDIEWYEFCTRDECAFDGEYIDENEISCKDCLYLGCDF